MEMSVQDENQIFLEIKRSLILAQCKILSLPRLIALAHRAEQAYTDSSLTANEKYRIICHEIRDAQLKTAFLVYWPFSHKDKNDEMRQYVQALRQKKREAEDLLQKICGA